MLPKIWKFWMISSSLKHILNMFPGGEVWTQLLWVRPLYLSALHISDVYISECVTLSAQYLIHLPNSSGLKTSRKELAGLFAYWRGFIVRLRRSICIVILLLVKVNLEFLQYNSYDKFIYLMSANTNVCTIAKGIYFMYKARVSLLYN